MCEPGRQLQQRADLQSAFAADRRAASRAVAASNYTFHKNENTELMAVGLTSSLFLTDFQKFLLTDLAVICSEVPAKAFIILHMCLYTTL